MIMKILRFNGYGVNSQDKYIALNRILHFEAINYNGNHGTCIVLDSQDEICVGHFPEDVKKILEQCNETP
jgi:superfamily II DNA/RNA helicase